MAKYTKLSATERLAMIQPRIQSAERDHYGLMLDLKNAPDNAAIQESLNNKGKLLDDLRQEEASLEKEVKEKGQ